MKRSSTASESVNLDQESAVEQRGIGVVDVKMRSWAR